MYMIQLLLLHIFAKSVDKNADKMTLCTFGMTATLKGRSRLFIFMFLISKVHVHAKQKSTTIIKDNLYSNVFNVVNSISPEPHFGIPWLSG